jgi:import inner membrane translocase subunit TIM50
MSIVFKSLYKSVPLGTFASRSLVSLPASSLSRKPIFHQDASHSAAFQLWKQCYSSKPPPKLDGLAAQTLLGVLEDPPSDKESNDKETPKAPSSKTNALSSSLKVAFFTSLFLGGVWMVGAPGEDFDDTEVSPNAFYSRATTRISRYFTSFMEPAFEKLLPDPLPHGYQKDYTLVINLNDTLIHSSWDAQHGWRVAKRPGIDYFLGYLARYYEIVLFTHSSGFAAEPLLDKVDSYRAIQYRLYKDAITYKNGKYIKDLSKLNRDLSKVIIMDWDDDAISFQPENAIRLRPWKGERDQPELKEYIPFLERIALSNAADVRPILAAYEGKDIPSTFAQRQAEYRKKLTEELANPQGAESEEKSSGFGLRTIFGGSRVAVQQQYQQHMDMYHHSQMMQKQFEEEAALVKQEVDRMREAEREAFQKMLDSRPKKTTLWKMFVEFSEGSMQPPQPV